jgi:hypothetical protein
MEDKTYKDLFDKFYKLTLLSEPSLEERLRLAHEATIEAMKWSSILDKDIINIKRDICSK